MKKAILLFVFAAGIAATNAQSLKVIIGPAYSEMNWESSPWGDGVDEYFGKPYTGLQVGVGIDYLRTGFFYLNSNIAYAMVGGDGEVMAVDQYGNDIGKTGTTTSLNLLTFNSSANFGIRISEKIFPYIGLGPRIEYLAGYKEDVALLKQFEDFGDLNKLIFGMLALAGINYEFDKFALGLEFHYNHNFNKLVNQTSTAHVLVHNEIN